MVVVAWSYVKAGRDAGEGACTCSMLRAAIRSLIEAAMVSITLQEKESEGQSPDALKSQGGGVSCPAGVQRTARW